jgi:D,D-heptose 1,7-bisphosphate phosphatase
MKKILVIRLSAIGDVILTSPALINLKIFFPSAQVWFLTRPPASEIASLLPGVDEIIEFPKEASAIDLFKTGEMLDKIGFDMVIDLHGNFRSSYLARHISAPLKVRYEKRQWERIQAVIKGRWKKNLKFVPHTIDLYNKAIKQTGGQVYAYRPTLRISDINVQSRLFLNDNPIVAIAPGASYLTKKWPMDRFRELALKLYHELAANILLILADADRKLLSVKKDIAPEKIQIFLNEKLAKLAGHLSTADILICNDSALSHLGSAVGTPVIAIFGPTHPTLGFAPRGLRDIILQTDEYCRPCSLHGKKQCFREEQYCFTKISVDDVFGAIHNMIHEKSKGVPAAFLDRDGTLIKERHFLNNPDEIEPENGAIEAVKKISSTGYKVIAVSNQSGIARGFFTEEKTKEINKRVLDIFEKEGAHIDGIYYCPHYIRGTVPQYAIECNCRKPSPGMVEQACREHNINPFASYVIGDKISDIQLAYVTGGKGIFVKTGHGAKEEQNMDEFMLKPEIIVDNINDGADYILGQGKRGK